MSASELVNFMKREQHSEIDYQKAKELIGHFEASQIKTEQYMTFVGKNAIQFYDNNRQHGLLSQTIRVVLTALFSFMIRFR